MLRKNILVVIPEKDNNDEFKNWMEKIFSLENLDVFVFNNNQEKFDAKSVVVDYVINFLDDKDDYEHIQKKIELLKIDYFGNKYSDIKLFSEKNNFKKIIERSNFKTPVFEKIEERNALDLFNNFPLPLRIFSKENNYFSEKLSSLDDIKEIYSETKERDIFEYFVEEYIEGEEIYGFSFFEEGEWRIFLVKNNNGIFEKVSDILKLKIESDVVEFLKYSQIKEFALLNLNYSEKRGLYFLNIFLKNSMLYKYEEILDSILEINSYKNLKEILKKNLF